MKPWQYWSLSGLVIAVAALYVGGWYLSGRSLPRDTTIANVDVSSMTPAAAAKVLAEGIETRGSSGRRTQLVSESHVENRRGRRRFSSGVHRR